MGASPADHGVPARCRRSIEIEAPSELVFALWSDYERLPDVMENVRRIKIIDDRRMLWDVDVAGQQLVWEARVGEVVRGLRIRWESTWGTPNRGAVRFEPLPGERTRLDVEIDYWPRGLLERIGARLGLVALHVRRDLERFRLHAERAARQRAPEPAAESPRRAANSR